MATARGRITGTCDCFDAKRLLTSGLKFGIFASMNLEATECLSSVCELCALRTEALSNIAGV